MAHWLVKSEPSAWSWDDHVRAGTEAWTGVRNHQAANSLKAMRTGDTVLFYHSVQDKQVVGIAEVVREAYPDPTDPSGRWVAVDLRTGVALPRPVTLAVLKSDPRLSGLPLIRQSRLSVMPIADDDWRLICALGGLAG